MDESTAPVIDGIEGEENRPRFLTVPEVAAELRLTEQATRGLIRRGDLPAVKLGKVYRLPRAELEQRLAARAQSA